MEQIPENEIRVEMIRIKNKIEEEMLLPRNEINWEYIQSLLKQLVTLQEGIPIPETIVVSSVTIKDIKDASKRKLLELWVNEPEDSEMKPVLHDFYMKSVLSIKEYKKFKLKQVA